MKVGSVSREDKADNPGWADEKADNLVWAVVMVQEHLADREESMVRPLNQLSLPLQGLSRDPAPSRPPLTGVVSGKGWDWSGSNRENFLSPAG